MTAEVSIGNGDGARLSPHMLRAAVLGEVHARPFTPIETPRRVLHFAFDTTGERAQVDRTALNNFVSRCGLAPLKPTDKQLRVVLNRTRCCAGSSIPNSPLIPGSCRPKS
jgi:uncharacterized membrane-anchored protein